MGKKKIILISVEIFLIVMLLVCYYVIFSPKLRAKIDTLVVRPDKNELSVSESYNSENEINHSEYPLIKADILVEGNIVKIKQNIFLDKPQDVFHGYIPSNNFVKTTIKDVLSSKGFKAMKVDGTNLSIDFEEMQNEIQMEYELVLNSNAQPLLYTEDFILLTNFMITPALYRNNMPILSYKWDFGDPYVYNINNYNVTVTTNRDMSTYASGKKSEEIKGEQKVTVFEAKSIRDFAIVVSKGADVVTTQVGNTIIYYIDSINARQSVERAFQFASEKIGTYTYNELFIVKAPISQNGMEFSNMLFISDKCFKNSENLKRVVYHEVFHQWFYGIIGTDQLNEPFLDEGLVNYLALMLSGRSVSDNYNGMFNLKLSDYDSKQQYYDLVYNNSASYFSSLHKRLGDDFFVLLQKIYKDKKHSILYFDEFLEYVNEYLGGQ